MTRSLGTLGQERGDSTRTSIQPLLITFEALIRGPRALKMQRIWLLAQQWAQEMLSRCLQSAWVPSRQVWTGRTKSCPYYSPPRPPAPEAIPYIKLTFLAPFEMSLQSLEAQYDNLFCDFSIIKSNVKTEQNLRSQIQAPLYRQRTEAWTTWVAFASQR